MFANLEKGARSSAEEALRYHESPNNGAHHLTPNSLRAVLVARIPAKFLSRSLGALIVNAEILRILRSEKPLSKSITLDVTCIKCWLLVYDRCLISGT